MGKKFRSGKTLALFLAFAVAGLFSAAPAEAQKTKGKTRPAETKYLMRGINQPHCAAIGGLLKDKGPADDKAWDTLACHASILNELSYVLMDDGRCPDKDWLGAAKDLRESTARVLDAARAKNLTDAQTAFKGVTGACATCHKAHKK
jgi:cytochrome c556